MEASLSTNTRFVVTNKGEEPDELYESYTERGETENRIKDFKLALKADRTSCHRFIAKPVPAVAARSGILAFGHSEEQAGGRGSRAAAA